MEYLAPMFAIVGAFGSISWVTYIIVDLLRQRHRLKVASEFHGKLLDRIGSAREFGEFLNTEGGLRFMNSLSTGGPAAPHSPILRSVQSGIVLAVLGLGFFSFVWSNPTISNGAHRGLTFLAVVAFTLGLGLLLAASASYALSRRMGLIDGDNMGQKPPTPSP